AREVALHDLLVDGVVPHPAAPVVRTRLLEDRGLGRHVIRRGVVGEDDGSGPRFTQARPRLHTARVVIGIVFVDVEHRARRSSVGFGRSDDGTRATYALVGLTVEIDVVI